MSETGLFGDANELAPRSFVVDEQIDAIDAGRHQADRKFPTG
jgi:hypothetical protein